MALVFGLINAILPSKKESAAHVEDSEVLAGLVGFIWGEHCSVLDTIV